MFNYWKAGPGDALADWDDLVASRNGTVLIDNRAVTWRPPIVSGEPARSVAGTWVTFLPHIWNGSTRPAIWSDIGRDTYPMPGSLIVSCAPAWYTWACTDSAAATSRPGYAFGSLFNPRASGSSISVAREPGATVSYTFVGNALSWVYAAGPWGGTATLSVDPREGSDAPTQMWTADQYSPAMEFGRRFDLTGLGAGTHTILIVNTGRAVPASSGTVVTSDAFVVGGVTFED